FNLVPRYLNIVVLTVSTTVTKVNRKLFDSFTASTNIPIAIEVVQSTKHEKSEHLNWTVFSIRQYHPRHWDDHQNNFHVGHIAMFPAYQ
ncbi:MAG: hypothetical protein NZ744_01200, partial [Pirellulaceae bacterium]|nr:hypothetical protein [Pirellulaceae bacterium]